jgi:hypothetical protein
MGLIGDNSGKERVCHKKLVRRLGHLRAQQAAGMGQELLGLCAGLAELGYELQLVAEALEMWSELGLRVERAPA